MKITPIKNSVLIKAPKEKVWAVLFEDHYYRIWCAEFAPGSYAETDWQLGSKAIFRDPEGNGLIGVIDTHRLYEFLSITFTGILNKGKEEYESTDAYGLKGAKETYRLSEEAGGTLLNTSADMGEDYLTMMEEAWKRAIKKIVELAENN